MLKLSVDRGGGEKKQRKERKLQDKRGDEEKEAVNDRTKAKLHTCDSYTKLLHCDSPYSNA